LGKHLVCGLVTCKDAYFFNSQFHAEESINEYG
jgi:hypothetical protein